METVACALCGSTQTTLKYSGLPDLALGTDSITCLVRCNQCGLVYQNPRLTQEEIGKYYPDEYDCYADVNIQPQTVGLLKHAYQYGLDKRSRSVTRQKRNGRLLDVGCASGVFLNHFRQQPGWNVFGVEINPEAAAYARNQYHLNVTTGTVEQASFPEGHFDAVTLWDVLEHFHDPVASLREIRRILKPDGILVFRVPNGASWDAKIFGRYWVGLEAPRHLYIYDPPTINSLLRKTGFNRLSLTTQGAGYTTFVLSLGYWRSSHSHHEKKKQPSDQIMTILKHPIARLLSAPVFYLPGVFQRGPMMTVTAAKSSGEGLA